jgi:S-adenosylmethionine:tRNA ribosyltransferase-isomerase
MNRPLTLDDFDFTLPDNLIAQEPKDQRDQSRLLVWREQKPHDHVFSDLATLLPEGTLLVLNDTKVIPGRLLGQTPHGGRIEIMLLEPETGKQPEQTTWRAIGKPMKKLGAGQQIHFAEGCQGLVRDKVQTATGPVVTIDFNLSPQAFSEWLDHHGFIPLPPYIQRNQPLPARNSPDRDRYQTVFAQDPGSVAAPTAGLHFTPDVLERLQAQGIEIAYVTLHVGGGTFLPVKTDDPQAHQMHHERYRISRQSYQQIADAMAAGRPIVPVGTTSFRCLQAFGLELKSPSASMNKTVDRWLQTDLFIYPRTAEDRYEPWAATGLLTNFHQPKSTLFMLVCGLIGWENAHQLYGHAIEQKYRFFSYGDATLLWFDR